MRSIDRNIEEIEAQIAEFAQKAGRDSSEIRLMAVTKTYQRSVVEEAYNCGHRLFGENRVREASEKLSGFYVDAELHLIGHLQRNKAKAAAKLFSCVQSIDKPGTALALDKHAKELGRKIDILFEVNTSGEENKHGFTSEHSLWEAAAASEGWENLKLRGLMTMAPFTTDEVQVRNCFKKLKELFEELKTNYPFLNPDTLSMGMSGDYRIAIEEGATLVRIGTAIFGAR